MRHISILPLLALGVTACATTSPTLAPPVSTTPHYETRAQAAPSQAEDAYFTSAAAAVDTRAGEAFVPKAKNIIIFIGDGMGVSTITAARIYAGQTKGVDGESYRLAMETLPHTALSKTYSHDTQVADSAATATAIMSGMKTSSGVLGISADAGVGNCARAVGKGSDTIFELAEAAGMATGIISTARITHATPAATYAESASRDWEDDTAFGDAADPSCPDIAKQLVSWPAGDGFEVILGGGRGAFLPATETDPETGNPAGRRNDGANLIEEWTAKSADNVYVYDQAGFDAAPFDSDAKIMGLFEPSHMQYDIDRPDDVGGEPSIADMTRAAITRLSRGPDGFTLLVEGGRIDHAHHGVNAARAVSDASAFDDAVAAALEMTSAEDTLIIVTADHSHTMTIAGYPRRNNPILGKVIYPSGVEAKAGDGLPYTTLGYANGETGCKPGAEDCHREDLSDVDTTDPDYHQQSLIFSGSETHGGEDVAVFASGPGSELVAGVMEQNEIFHVMARSSGLLGSE